jgi:hypothetical protein
MVQCAGSIKVARLFSVQAIRAEKEKEGKQRAAAKKVLHLSLAERTAVQTRWGQLSHDIIREVDLRVHIEIQLVSVDRFLAATLKDWSSGMVDRARRSHAIAQETRQRALDLCQNVAWSEGRAALLKADDDRQEMLTNLDAYLVAAVDSVNDVVVAHLANSRSYPRVGDSPALSWEHDSSHDPLNGSKWFSSTWRKTVHEQVMVIGYAL